MGFSARYTKQMVQNFRSYSRFCILTLLRFLGLSYILEPQICWPDPEPESRPVAASIFQEMLPVMKFTDVACANGPDPLEECAVCLYEFRDHDEVRQLTNCKHIFHRMCVDRWMDHDQISCPLCRTPFVPDELMEVFHEKLGAAAAAATVSAIPEFGGEFCVINRFL